MTTLPLTDQSNAFLPKGSAFQNVVLEGKMVI